MELNEWEYREHEEDLHLDDYESLLKSITDKENYSLENRLSKAAKYPVSKPFFESFPEIKKEKLPSLPKEPIKPVIPKKLEPKIIPIKFFDYLLILPCIEKTRLNREEKKRVETEYNQKYGEFFDAESKYEEYHNEFKEKIELSEWLKQFNKDRGLYLEPQREVYDLNCKKAVFKWEHDKSKYEAEFKDSEKYKEICSNYDSGESNYIIDYFNIQLTSLPQPEWWENKFDLQFDTDEGILLIELQLPFLKDTEK